MYIKTFNLTWHVTTIACNVDGESKLLYICLWARLDYT